jgi:predicted TIM-barrel fold metal-dependent hydrolase
MSHGSPAPDREPDRASALLERLLLRDWQPRSQARTPSSQVVRPDAPCIDVHNHLGRWLSDDGDWLVGDVRGLLGLMDDHDVETVVNLDGRWGEELTANLNRYDWAHPGRFVTFAQLDWTALQAADPTAALLGQLDAAARQGARGLKVWKDLGLQHRDGDGRLALPDDPRLLPVFARAGELGLPVLIHTADPVAFFEPLDERNERVDELAVHPDWWFGGPGMPTFDRLIDALETVVAATPGTSWIGAHVGCYAEDLGRVDRMLGRYPHFHVDIGGRVAELGRAPRAFARLVAAHPTQVLFGTDSYPPSAQGYELAFRFVQTDDESYDYEPGCFPPPQGRWQISAADLPDPLLPDFYAGNAARLLRLR